MFLSLKKVSVSFLLLCILPLNVFAAPATSQVPLDSWVYSALDKLSALGLIDSDLQGARPYTRYEVARQLEAAGNAASYSNVSPAIAGLIRRMEREFADSLADLHSGYSEGYFKPREIQLKYVYQDGKNARSTGNNVAINQFPLNFNNYGLSYQEQNAQMVLQGEARLGSFLLVEARPILQLQDGDQSESDVRLFDGRIALQLGAFEVSVGRQSLWWGQGRHGSIVLTNNAQPLDMIRLTNPTPTLLPWIFKYLGPFRFDVFWSKLEEDRIVPEPYFAGLRFNFKPLPWVELGASRAVMFGGEGRPDLSWDDYITILGGKNLSGAEDTSNSVAAIDGRVRLPFLWNAEIYGELGGEDEANYFPSKTGYIAGIYLPQVEPSQRLSLRFEYADLHLPTWFSHSQYRSGYTYEGNIMGHHTGGAAKDAYVELQAIISEKLLLTIGLDYEERGVDQLVQEELSYGLVKVDWSFAEHYSVDCSLGFGKIDNFEFVAGNSEDVGLISIGLRGYW